MSPSTMAQETFRELIIDYLDGQLSEDARQAFEQTMQAQPEWAEDVRALERTWQQARQTLKASERPAPSRVRAHVLAEASKRAAMLREQNQVRNKATSASQQVGVVERIRKSWLGRPWFAPVFLAAAAVGLYVINQKSFETTRARSVGHSLDEAQETQPFPVTSPVSPEATEEPAAADELKGVSAPAAKGDELYAKGKPLPKPAQKQKRAGIEGSARDATIGELLGGEGYAQPPAGWGRGEVAPPQAAKASKTQRADVDESRSYGTAEGLAPEADSAPVRSAPVSSAPAGAAAPARAPAAPPPAASGAGAPPRSAERAPRETVDDAELEQDAVSEGVRRDPAWTGLSRADLLARAQRAEASGQWSLVIGLYNELLRRHPKDEQAPAWKQGIARAQQALH